MATAPVPLATAGGITYGQAKTTISRVVDNGVCDDDARVLERVDEAQKYLLSEIIPVNGCATYDIVADGTKILLPPELENAIEVEVVGTSSRINNQSDVKQGWYDIVNNFTYVDPEMQHDFPLVDEFLRQSPTDPYTLVRQYDFPGLTAGATVRVTGKKAFVPIRSDSDYLIIQNVRAIKTAVMGFERYDVNDGATGKALLADAVQMLKDEVQLHLLDPRQSLKRRANWEKDLTAYPINSFGWTRARMALEITGIQTKGKSEITRLMEMAERRLLSKGIWKDSFEVFTAEVVNGLIRMPLRVESVLAARLDGLPIDVRSIFFGYQKNGPGYLSQCITTCAAILSDQGEIYDPTTRSSRHVYQLTGAFSRDPNVDPNAAPTSCLSMVCKLRWVPKQPTEQMVIKNFEAMRLMIEGILIEEAGKDSNNAAKAERELDTELNQFLGGIQAVPHIDMIPTNIMSEVY